MAIDHSEPVDILGVGYGPSNLGLAIALQERNRAVPQQDRLTSVFVERQLEFRWHPGMLLPGATMQISFLKDLATQRNTRSEYTFLEYLAQRDRLTHFINLQTFFPSRLEFHDYLTWAAAKVDADVAYGTSATSVAWKSGCFEVSVTDNDGRPSMLRARNVVLAGGLTPTLPAGVAPSARVFHNHRILDHLEALPDLQHRRFVVVGAGQSAAEVVAHLHDRYRDAEVHGVFGKYGYSPADDSPYANRVFDPEAVDDFYSATPQLREQLINYHRSTNYSAVDLPLIEDLYNREYGERVSGDRRLFVHGASEVSMPEPIDNGVEVAIVHRPTGRVERLDCDAVVYATGFRSLDLRGILGELGNDCVFAPDGTPEVERDYRLRTDESITGGIYLQGGTEHSHGLTSSLLSNIAVRSGELVDSLGSRALLDSVLAR
ncbi:lysine N(6)-hydroxylase/L-ornithine N(5)-oxygenase family protein [Rhodococcoides fascians A25f]|uniref:lysine N(6)-hydroxylase/L-ornithine N(5)-oxygenase family protein n=1 Tax=Rhodococcoides fascians TaxID=1828 RepID=UPI0005663423|nr:SidA/IucD/PvdA family monooxygenase [Rhodococcus fascians]QII07686.1 lysine N(6)-hydroxylase/L-ornithine N(5)-oxygenase family protein [Rhodococcus fascians A25f]